VRQFVRKFRATVVELPPETEIPPDEENTGDDHKCALCRRETPGAKLGQDGRWWCTGSEESVCIRLAQGRLGGATAPGRASLSGRLRPDGKCRQCRQQIRWVKTQRGKNMAVDIDPAPAGVDAFELIGEVKTIAFYVSERKRAGWAGDVYRPHFKTCEKADA